MTRQQAVSDDLDRRDLRRALGQFATGVAVITCRAANDRAAGMTANSLASVSLNPPLLLWCIGRKASTFGAFNAASYFGVNILAADQHPLARQFSGSASNRWAGITWYPGHQGVPLLVGASAHFSCRIVARHDAGDHVLLVGEIVDYAWQPTAPLVFHAGSYQVVTRHPAS